MLFLRGWAEEKTIISALAVVLFAGRMQLTDAKRGGRAGEDLGSITKTYKVLGAMAGSLLLFAAVPAWSQQNFAPAPVVVAPVVAPTPRIPSKPPRVPVVADRLLPSTELGFEKGIGPAVGRVIVYRDKRYEVTEVNATGGGPTFSGNSRFAIAPEGRGLIVGLKSIDPEVFAALPASPGALVN